MPIYNHTCLSEFFAASRSEDDFNYLDAANSVLGTFISADATGTMGWTRSSKWIVGQGIVRFDLRAYKGAKATAVTFKCDHNTVNLDSGGTVDLYLRSYVRNDPNGLLSDTLDWYSLTLVQATTNYAEYLNLAPTTTDASIAFTNNGTELLDAINAAVAGDGVLDAMIVDERMMTSTPPSVPTNQDWVSFNGPWQAFEWKTKSIDNPPRLEITWEFEGVHLVPEVSSPTVGDCFMAGVQGAIPWSQALNGPANAGAYESSALSARLACDKAFGSISNNEFFIRFDASVIDGGKGIKAATFVLSGHDVTISAASAQPWHIRRHDWTGSPALGQYLTGAELALLTKVGEFTFDDINNQDYPLSDEAYNVLWKYYLPMGQDFIDALNEGDSNTGFVIHNERMITGVEPTDGDFVRANISLGTFDVAGHYGMQIIVEYDDGSLFFGSVF